MEGVLELYRKREWRLYSKEQLPSSDEAICFVCHSNTHWLLNPRATMDGKPERFRSLTHTKSRDCLWKLPSERNLLSLPALKTTSALWTLTYWKDILFEEQTFNLKHFHWKTDYLIYTTVQKLWSKKLILWFRMDALNWSNFRVKSFTVLQQIWDVLEMWRNVSWAAQ